MGETISYSGGGIPYVDGPMEITPDTPKPDHEVIGEIKVMRARMEWLDEENRRLRKVLDEVAMLVESEARNGSRD